MAKGSLLLKKIGLWLVGVVCVMTIAGYITAKSAQTAIESEIRSFVQSKGIMGRDLGGERVPPEVGSRIDWPFVVTAWYSVPLDLHAAYHQTKYLVLPWRKYVIGKEDIFPV